MTACSPFGLPGLGWTYFNVNVRYVKWRCKRSWRVLSVSHRYVCQFTYHTGTVL